MNIVNCDVIWMCLGKCDLFEATVAILASGTLLIKSGSPFGPKGNAYSHIRSDARVNLSPAESQEFLKAVTLSKVLGSYTIFMLLSSALF